MLFYFDIIIKPLQTISSLPYTELTRNRWFLFIPFDFDIMPMLICTYKIWTENDRENYDALHFYYWRSGILPR